MAAKRYAESGIDPRKLTPLVGQAQHVWGKLLWEAAQLRMAHQAQPFDVPALTYGAIKFAVTAASLEDWLWKLAARQLAISETRSRFGEAVAQAVPLQPAFRDIANTFKHGAHRDQNWRGGTVELVHFPAFSGTPREYILIYHSDLHGQSQTSLDLFDVATEQWAEFIRASGLLALLEAASRSG